MGHLGRRLSGGRGSVRWFMGGGLGGRARLVLARADSVRSLVGSSNNALGRFKRDSTLIVDVADIRDELANVRAALVDSRGTAGRALNDSAAFRAVDDVHREMS